MSVLNKGLFCLLTALVVFVFNPHTEAQSVQSKYEREKTVLDFSHSNWVLPGGSESLAAPPAPVRQPGEFEPMQGVMIRYPFGITYDLIAEMSEDVEVVTVVADASEESYVRSQYASHGVTLSNCSFLHTPSQSYWSRDWGPWFVIDGNETQAIVDNDYPWNEPGSDYVPVAYGLDQGIPSHQTGIYHEGGNYMTDGQGISISTDLVWADNPGVPQGNIHQIVEDCLGIHTYHVIPYAMTGFVRHIDCVAKYLTPDTIMVLEVPPSHPRYTHVEEMVENLENRLSCYWTPYKVVRVYTPTGEAYTNSLILNDKVLVPAMGSQWDDEAIVAYEQAMPGYEVLGFTGTWWTEDALHCRTMGITDREMLYIHHQPLLDRPPMAQGFPVEAEIIAYSGEALTSGTPEVIWTTDGTWNTLAMTHVGGDDYVAYIPNQPVGSTIRYYIHAEEASGRGEYHPYIGEPQAHSFEVTHLGNDVSALSVEAGGVVHFYLNAGAAHAGKKYFLLASVSGTTPGTPLPGGGTLPLNWDLLTDFVLAYANQAFFTDFRGVLDGSGIAIATLDTLGALPREMEGATMHFAFLLYLPYEFTSNAVEVRVVQ